MKPKGKNIKIASRKVNEPFKVIIADDHYLVRKQLLNTVKKNAFIKIVGEFEKINEVIDNLQILEPDVIFLDVTLPDISGTDAISLLLKKKPDLNIIALAMPDSNDMSSEYINRGAKGYVFKNASAAQLISAIEKVQNGEIYDILKESEITYKEYNKKTRSSGSTIEENILTDKETEVLIYVVNGMSNNEISDKLSLSIRTVETHRHNIKKKLNISSAAGLKMYAIEAGLLKQ
jgi:DNA-binding NarL/FixJ family response regulator